CKLVHREGLFSVNCVVVIQFYKKRPSFFYFSFTQDILRSPLLCTTPYTRRRMIEAKYLFILVIFMGTFLLYNLAVAIGPSKGLERLTTFQIGISLMMVSILFGILIPIQLKIGFERTKYFSFFTIFLIPFIVPAIIEGFQSQGINLQMELVQMLPIYVREWLPIGVSFVIGIISMKISIRIFTAKNL
ncbi:ABC-2 transporter permease, partial [Mesobacillus zeae]